MAYTLTQWWTQLAQDLSNFAVKPWVSAARTMATEGIKIEKNPTQGRQFEKLIDEAAKDLGAAYTSKKVCYLPNVDDPEQLIFAVIYYKHLLRYKDIDSNTIGGMIGWSFLKFVQNELPRVQENGIELKRRIERYCNNPANFEKLKQILSGISSEQLNSTDQIIEYIAHWVKLQPGLIGDFPAPPENSINPEVLENTLPASNSISEYLSQHVLSHLVEHSISSEEIGKLIVEIEKINAFTTQLLRQKENVLDINKEDLEKKIGAIKTLLFRVMDDELAYHPQGFIKLMKEYPLGFKFILLETKGGPLLAQKVKTLKKSGIEQGTYPSIESLIKMASYFTPTFIQKIITHFVPVFLDNDCKRTFKILALDYLDVLQKKLESIELLEPKELLIDEEQELQLLLTKAPVDELQAAQVVNDARKELLQQYQNLLSTAERHKNSLEYIRGYHASLDKIIELHDNWFVKLSNWISETISCWFKTDASWLKTNTAKILAEVRTKKVELQELEKQYQEDFSRTVETALEISQKSSDEQLKTILNEKISMPPEENKYRERVEELKDKKARQAFLYVQNMFKLSPKEHSVDQDVSCTLTINHKC